jgi:hypothetical protein
VRASCIQCFKVFPIFAGSVLHGIEGLEHLKDVFIELLVETSKDFSLRAVPLGKQFLQDEDRRVGMHRPRAQGEPNESFAPLSLVRSLSDDLSMRFERIKAWEDTEHPIVVFYRNGFGEVIIHLCYHHYH